MFKTTPKVNTKLKLTLIPAIYDYIFSTAINNIVFYQKHLLLLHGDRDLNPAAKKGPNTDQKNSLFGHFSRSVQLEKVVFY